MDLLFVRGLLAAGMAGDVVVVNGRVALRDGTPTGARAGQALRRTAHMPTRPMNAGEARTAVRRATSRQDAVVIDVTQAKGARTARGTFRLTQKASGVGLDMKAFGQLQTAPGWASFTGRARLRPSEPERSVTVILDAGEVVVRAGDFGVTISARR